ncbi:uncharacterized protein LOC144164799 [Haemaphysalis longicornis]
MRAYLEAFLRGRQLRVRLPGCTSSARSVTTGVPQGSVLSPFLFNLALATLPEVLPNVADTPTYMSIYADDVAIWCTASKQDHLRARDTTQTALSATVDHLKHLGLEVSHDKTAAMVYHPTAANARQTPPLHINSTPLPWQKEAKYLGIKIHHPVTWLPLVKMLRGQLIAVQRAIRSLAARGRCCSQEWALRVYDAAGVSHILYALTVITPSKTNWAKVERDHTAAIRLGLPRSSPIAETLAEGNAWPAQLRTRKAGLCFIDRLVRAPDGAALLKRLQARTASTAGRLAAAYAEITGLQQPLPLFDPLPPHRTPTVEIKCTLPGVRGKRRELPQALRFAAAEQMHEEPTGNNQALALFTDGSVTPGPPKSAAAACVAPQLNAHTQCRLPFPACSTTAELAGLHLAADMALDQQANYASFIIYCDNKAALQRLRRPHGHTASVALLYAKLCAVASQGSAVRLQWLPSHVGIEGNEAADALAKAAHSADAPITTDVCCIDEARNVIKDKLRGDHPDPRVAAGDPPPRVPTNKLSRQESALLSRLRTGCAVTNSRLHLYKKRDSPACSHCGAFDSIGHCIVECAAYNIERARLRAAYKRLGIPCSTKTELLFPRCPRSLLAGAYRLLLAFLEETGLASRL